MPPACVGCVCRRPAPEPADGEAARLPRCPDGWPGDAIPRPTREGVVQKLAFRGTELPRGSTPADLAALEPFFADAPDGTPGDIPRVLRFLRARKLSVPDALALWRQDQEWRAREGINGITTEAVDSGVERMLAGHYKAVLLDEAAHDGRLVMYRRLGELDVEKLRATDGLEVDDLRRSHIRSMETLRVKMDADKSGVGALGGHLSIIDLKGASLPKFLAARGFWMAISGLDGTHYAETLGIMLIINPPPLTAFALNTVKAFIDPVTAAKITVRSGPPGSFLHEYIGEHAIPTSLRSGLPPKHAHTR